MESDAVGEKNRISLAGRGEESRIDLACLCQSEFLKKGSSVLSVFFHYRFRADRRILYRASAGSEADGSAELARLGPSALLGRSNA